MNRRKRKRKFKKVVYLGVTLRHLPEPVRLASTSAGTPSRAMDNVPGTDPACAGVKVTVVVQLRAAASHRTQLLDSA